MNKNVMSLIIPAILSLTAHAQRPVRTDDWDIKKSVSWQGDFRFIISDGKTQLADRLLPHSYAKVEAHGLAFSVTLETRDGSKETFESVGQVKSIGCYNEATFKAIAKDHTIVFFRLTLPDSEKLTCPGQPTKYLVLQVIGFDVDENNHLNGNHSVTLFELPINEMALNSRFRF